MHFIKKMPHVSPKPVHLIGSITGWFLLMVWPEGLLSSMYAMFYICLHLLLNKKKETLTALNKPGIPSFIFFPLFRSILKGGNVWKPEKKMNSNLYIYRVNGRVYWGQTPISILASLFEVLLYRNRGIFRSSNEDLPPFFVFQLSLSLSLSRSL